MAAWSRARDYATRAVPCAQSPMQSNLAVVSAPILHLFDRVGRRQKPVGVQASARKRQLKASMQALSVNFRAKIKGPCTCGMGAPCHPAASGPYPDSLQLGRDRRQADVLASRHQPKFAWAAFDPIPVVQLGLPIARNPPFERHPD